MDKTIVVKGRLLDSSTVELAEPVPGAARDVEVIVRVPGEPMSKTDGTLLDFLKGLPAGTRTKQEIDRQIQEERDSWGVR